MRTYTGPRFIVSYDSTCLAVGASEDVVVEALLAEGVQAGDGARSAVRLQADVALQELHLQLRHARHLHTPSHTHTP